MGRRRRYDDEEGDDDYDAPRRRDDDDDDYDDAPRRRRSGGSSDDVPGVVGVVCGGLAVVCLIGGCLFACIWIFAPIFALVGGITSFFAKGNLKTIGLVLNGVVLVLSIVMVILAVVVGVGFLAAIPAAGQPARAR